MSFDFASAGYLVLLALVPWVVLMGRGSLAGLGAGRARLALALRVGAIVLTVLALARLRLLRENDRLCVLFVVDRSDSIPLESRAAVMDAIRAAQDGRDAVRGDYVGVIIFGKDAGVEQVPRQGVLDFASVATLVDPAATDIESALQLAAASFPEDVGGRRIVVFTDGNENHGRAVEEARGLRALGIEVDVVPIVYEHDAEISVDKVVVPSSVERGEPFGVRVVVNASKATEARVRLFENGRVIFAGDEIRRLEAGRNFLEFSGLRREETGRLSYEVQVEPVASDGDAVVQNNVGFGFTMIQGESRVLLVTMDAEGDAWLARALRSEKMSVDVALPEETPRSIEEYFEYGAIVLSNVGAHRFSDERLQLFRNLVGGMGLGLIMIGGEESFGAGGWQGTPVEEVLPVSLELDDRKQLPNGALAMIVHSCELGNGNAWARQVVQQAIKILSPRDYAGVLYYDHMAQEQWLFPMTRCADRSMMLSKLRGFTPGDMPTFHPIVDMASKGLSQVKAAIKHIIVLSDGDPTAPSPQLLQRITQDERVTISAIAYGAHGGGVTPTMKTLAASGRGKVHYLTDPRRLPEIFLREATTVRKALLSNESFRPLVHEWNEMLGGLRSEDFPFLEGYVLTTPRPLADLLLVHPATEENPSQDPVLAAWTFELGRSVAFTSDAGRVWGRPWLGWEGYRRFWSQVVRWATKPIESPLFRVSRQWVDGKIVLAADLVGPDGEFVDGAKIEGSLVTPGRDGRTERFEMRQIAPGRYRAPDFVADGSGTYGVHLATSVGGEVASYSTGVSVPYSPEYRQTVTDHDLLERLALAGGGNVIERPDAPTLFARDFASSRAIEEMWSPLLTLALILFFSDVFIRRVLIDVGALRRGIARVAAGVKSRLARRGAARDEPADERLAELLRSKERTRAARGVDAPSSPPVSSDVESGVEFDARFDAGATSRPPTPPPSTSAPRPKPAKEAEVRSDDDSYTARLLRAKRRAHENDED